MLKHASIPKWTASEFSLSSTPLIPYGEESRFRDARAHFKSFRPITNLRFTDIDFFIQSSELQTVDTYDTVRGRAFHELRRASQVNQRHLRNVAPQRSDAYVSPAAIVFISLTGNQLNTKRNDALHKHDDGTSCRCRVD